MTNEGDFVCIGTPLGAQLRNLNYAWMCPVPLEKAVDRDPASPACSASPATRCCSSTARPPRWSTKSLPYNELAQTFFEWDATAGEYPNLVLCRSGPAEQEHSASDEYRR